jgi:hypothetical protein
MTKEKLVTMLTDEAETLSHLKDLVTNLGIVCRSFEEASEQFVPKTIHEEHSNTMCYLLNEIEDYLNLIAENNFEIRAEFNPHIAHVKQMIENREKDSGDQDQVIG